MPPGELHIHADPEALNRALAEQIATLASRAVATRGWFSIALAGGSSPRSLYALLSAPPYTNRIDWSQTDVFFSDERCVAHTHPHSNYRMVKTTLLDRLPVPPQVHPVPTEDPLLGADEYEAVIRARFADTDDQIPQFDLILLGMGADGHTASLFPDTAALGEHQRLVAANFVPALDSWRITLTYPLINAARHVFFLVTGTDKAHTLARIFDNGDSLPVERIRPRGYVAWHVDRAAAAYLQTGENE